MKYRNKKKVVILLVLGLFTPSIHSVTYVYNLKIAESIKHQSVNGGKSDSSAIAITPIRQYRKRKNSSEQDVFGGLATYIHNHNQWYFRVDAGLGNVKEAGVSRTQLDDLVVTGGYGYDYDERTHFALSGLFGIPTHKDEVLQPIQFGVGHWALGTELDASWDYSHDQSHSIIGAFRYIYFFPREIDIILGPERREFDFDLGNLVDFLIGHMSVWGRNKVEFGYNPTIAFGAHLKPALDLVGNNINFTRQGFYGTYRYGFLINKQYISGITFGLSYSFDTKPPVVGFARIVSMWVTWGVKF